MNRAVTRYVALLSTTLLAAFPVSCPDALRAGAIGAVEGTVEGVVGDVFNLVLSALSGGLL